MEPNQSLRKPVKTKTSSKSLVYIYEYKKVQDLKLGKTEFWNEKKQEPGDPARLLLRHEAMKRQERHQTGRLQIKGEKLN